MPYKKTAAVSFFCSLSVYTYSFFTGIYSIYPLYILCIFTQHLYNHWNFNDLSNFKLFLKSPFSEKLPLFLLTGCIFFQRFGCLFFRCDLHLPLLKLSFLFVGPIAEIFHHEDSEGCLIGSCSYPVREGF